MRKYSKYISFNKTEGKRKFGEGQSIWLFNGLRLEGNKTFKDYGIENGCNIISMNF
jgi:hypothetical protein